MKSTDLLMIVAVIAVAFAAINLMVTINKVGDFKSLTGFASDTDTGTANLTIGSSIMLNFTVANISWGTGTIPAGGCELNTVGGMTCTGFATLSSGLILENIGNVNCSVNLTSNKDADSFIGGASPTFEWKVSESEGGSCAIGTSITSFTTIPEATTQLACENFNYDTTDTLEIDLNITIPQDATPEPKSAVITATGTAIA